MRAYMRLVASPLTYALVSHSSSGELRLRECKNLSSGRHPSSFYGQRSNLSPDGPAVWAFCCTKALPTWKGFTGRLAIEIACELNAPARFAVLQGQ